MTASDCNCPTCQMLKNNDPRWKVLNIIDTLAENNKHFPDTMGIGVVDLLIAAAIITGANNRSSESDLDILTDLLPKSIELASEGFKANLLSKVDMH